MTSSITQNYVHQVKHIIRNHSACVQLAGDQVAIPIDHATEVARQFSKQNPNLASVNLDLLMNVDPPHGGLIGPEKFLSMCLSVVRQNTAPPSSKSDDKENVILVFETNRIDSAHREISKLVKLNDEVIQREEKLESEVAGLSHAIESMRLEFSTQRTHWDNTHTAYAESTQQDLSELRREQKHIKKAQEDLAQRQENDARAIVHAEEAVQELSSALDAYRVSSNQNLARKSDLMRGFFRLLECCSIYQQLWNDSLRSRVNKLQRAVRTVKRLQRDHAHSFTRIHNELQHLQTLLDWLESPSGPISINEANLASIRVTVNRISDDLTDIRTSLDGAAAGSQTYGRSLAEELQVVDPWYQKIFRGYDGYGVFNAVINQLRLLPEPHLRGYWPEYVKSAIIVDPQARVQAHFAKISAHLSSLGDRIRRLSQRRLSLIVVTLVAFCLLIILLHGEPVQLDQVWRTNGPARRLGEGYHIVYVD
ncbi:hypothetical protein BJ138DRAFT_1118122 [Hygrophoropsis aurantiaca]|uniref:Uncharacterized protein n=1 Tax=Hygrophoropsis aurantiaca TaxID=72124 RepID=A0ACB7ZY22_9AGAM|nr:hypothetical protein BJ138DRAFT_1118122 [Hygrophoropsis aurantiaca]